MKERCHGSKEDYTGGHAHQPHWWAMYTKWCDGKANKKKEK